MKMLGYKRIKIQGIRIIRRIITVINIIWYKHD